MNTEQRSSLGAKLTELQTLALQVADGLHADREPLLATVDELHNRAAELLAEVVAMKRRPGSYSFPCGDVSPGDLVEIDDKGAQRVMAEQHAKASGEAA